MADYHCRCTCSAATVKSFFQVYPEEEAGWYLIFFVLRTIAFSIANGFAINPDVRLVFNMYGSLAKE